MMKENVDGIEVWRGAILAAINVLSYRARNLVMARRTAFWAMVKDDPGTRWGWN